MPDLRRLAEAAADPKRAHPTGEPVIYVEAHAILALYARLDALTARVRERVEDHDAQWEQSMTRRGAKCPCRLCESDRALLEDTP